MANLPESVIISQGLAKTGLSQFFQHGMGASSWAIFDIKERVRMAYIGTEVSNLSHLISLQRQGSGLQHAGLPLHLPHPQIRPTVPWKPNADQGLFGAPLRRTGSSDQVRDLSSFPAKDVRDSLVAAFFDQINPYYPVVDESQFQLQYADPANPPPLILLQAVLLAGAHVCDHPRVVQSRAMVKTALFRRAKALFDMRHENDRLHLIQCALLLTWHLENADTASANGYYWAGVACRIAFGIGMHRDLSLHTRTGMMPVEDRHLYRRVWWTLFQTEILTSLEHGTPSIIHLDDIDQPPLDLNDFTEANGLVNRKLRLDYCIRNIELCHLILDILRINRPCINFQAEYRSTLASLDSRLANWILTTPASNDFGSLQLHMHYHTVLIHLHRKFITESAGAMGVQQQQSIEICNRAVSAIISIFEKMLAGNMIAQCYFTSVIALTATAIHVSREIGLAIERGSTLLALNMQNQLERLFGPVKELSLYWPNAEAVQRLFQGLLDKFKTRVMEILRTDNAQTISGGRVHGQEIAQNSDRSDVASGQTHYANENVDANSRMYEIDWQDILLYPAMQQQYFNGDEDWMNVSPELGMGT